MNYLSVEALTKHYGDKPLFESISFGIDQGEKVALIAKNGSGKSTLFKCLAQLDVPDSGTIVYRKDISLGFLSQDPVFDANLTASEIIFHSPNPAMVAVRNYEKALENGNQTEIETALIAMEEQNAWSIEAQTKEILGKLQLQGLDTPFGSMSGGQQKRVALARLLMDEPDFVLLDEPTNHLDVEMIEWLEQFLSQSKMTLFMITHDRYFLDRVCNHIIEIDETQLYKYKGDYAYFLNKKAEREENVVANTLKAKNLMRKELEWIRRQPKARGTKAKYRVDAFDDIKKEASKKVNTDKVEMEVNMTRLGSKIIEIHNLHKAFGDKQLVKKFSYNFKRKEKIGIIGKNGTGKTTLLNMLMGLEPVDAGKIVTGDTLVFGYYTQSGMQLKEGMRVIEAIKEIADFLPMAGGKKLSAVQLLERFLFPTRTHFAHISTLSGGEKKRLYLLTVLMKNPNFLILDEPTNDLDIPTLAVLEEFLEDFPGCVIVVSHDRFFMDKIVDNLFVFEGEGNIRVFPGNYSDYRHQAALEEKEASTQKTVEEKEQPKPEIKQDKPKKKLSYNEQREYDNLEGEIEQLENKKSALNTELETLTDHEKMTTLAQELGEVMELIEEKTNRWIELDELAN